MSAGSPTDAPAHVRALVRLEEQASQVEEQASHLEEQASHLEEQASHLDRTCGVASRVVVLAHAEREPAVVLHTILKDKKRGLLS